MNNRWEHIKKLFLLKGKFALMSLVATVFDIIFFSVFIYIIFPRDGIEATTTEIATISMIGSVIGMLINFFLQKKYVFKMKRKQGIVFSLSMAVSIGGIFLDGLIVGYLSTLAIFSLYPILKIAPKIISRGTIFLYNFYLKRYVFEKRFFEVD